MLEKVIEENSVLIDLIDIRVKMMVVKDKIHRLYPEADLSQIDIVLESLRQQLRWAEDAIACYRLRRLKGMNKHFVEVETASTLDSITTS